MQWDKNINEIVKKPIKHCTFFGCSRGLDSMMMSSCLFTNAMSDPLLNMLILLGLPLSLRNRRKFWNTFRTILGQRYTTYMRLLWRPVGLSLLLIGGKVIVVGLPKGSPILNVQITSSFLPDWSLTPATCVMQVITLICASENHASKKSNPMLYQPLKSVNRHWLSEQFHYFVIPCEPEQSLCNITVLLRIYRLFSWVCANYVS